MENSSNASFAAGAGTGPCHYRDSSMTALSLIDVCSFVLGQPVFLRLLWFLLRSPKAVDVLNCHLAVFHYLQNWLTLVHLVLLHLRKLPHPQVLDFLLVYAQVGGPIALSSICLERLVAVSFPTSYPLLRTYRFREASVSIMWSLSLFLALIKVLPGQMLQGVRDTLVHTLPLSVLMSMSFMMVRCSVSIALALRRAGPGGGPVHPAKKRAFKTVCTTCGIVALCYAPVTAMQMVQTQNPDLGCFITPACVFLLAAASTVHPLCYLSTQGGLGPCCRGGRAP